MAIYHLSMKPIARSGGRSAVAAAAYRSAEMLVNERDGLVHDYRAKQGVEHAEIVLPDGVDAAWALNRSALWNAAEAAEKRKDARVAREFEVALPHELSGEQRIALVREFAQDLANRHGAAVDVAVHQPHSASDVRNIHAHILMTTRRVTEEGLGDKTFIERENKWLLSNDLPTSQMQLRDIRQSWEQTANAHLARAGLEIRIDHRSHAERGLEIEPTDHMGVHSTQMERRGLAVSRGRLEADAARRNADLIREKPEQVLTIITGEKSVFDRHDVARALHRYIDDDAQAFRNAFATVMASPALVELQPETADRATGEIALARYSTHEMVSLERGMADAAARMSEARSHGVDLRHVDRAMERQDAAIRQGSGDALAGLSLEQRRAIGHVTGSERMTVVVGYAGAGKSTMLAAAREAWEAQGYAVHGAALSGKAAEGLEESSGIASRTLASWEMSWQNDRRLLDRSAVFVIDEAGMVGSRQLARFVAEAEQQGAKIVLVGDHEQLQAIGAGAPFRAIAEQIGHAELSDIRRQREDWQREASVAFATHRTGEGLAAYQDHGAIHLADGQDEARAAIVRSYIADREAHPEASRVAMAHRRVDVQALNEGIRSALQDRDRLGRGEEGGERIFETINGPRAFAPDDRIVFLENNRELGVKNGMLGTVESVEPNAIQVRLDGKDWRADEARTVIVPVKDYQAVDHGYATTIHKNQGATVDRSFVLASGMMDRHLTYIAMTRHRDGVELHAARDAFIDKQAGPFGQAGQAGRLVEHGPAPYEHQAGNRGSYFVTLEGAGGERRTTWGVDLERAMAQAAPAIGATIGLVHEGSQTVRLLDGTEAQRHSWSVRDANELALAGLEARLSRSGAKETTLDYPRDFADRRGIAEAFGLRSDIELPRAEASRVEMPRQDLAIDRRQEARRDRQEPQPEHGRSAFDGLKLSRGAAVEGPARGPGPAETARELTRPAEVRQRGMFDGLRLPAPPVARPETIRAEQDRPIQRQADRLRPLSGFEQAVDRYARAHHAIERQMRDGLPVLEGQRQELHQAGLVLDQARPGAAALIVSAARHDPETARALTDLSGRERVGQIVAGMDRERAALADPNVRADRLIGCWQELHKERQALPGWRHEEARSKVEGQMRQIAGTIERDPQVESIVRDRAKELGIASPQPDRSIALQMERELSRGHGIGLER